MRTVLRWMGRILLALLALVFVAIVGLAIWLDTQQAQKLLKDKALVAANASLASGGIAIGELHVSLRRIEITDVAIAAANDQPVLSIEAISIGIAPWDLLHKRISVPSLSLTRPEIRLVHEGDHWLLPELKPSAEPSEPKPPTDTLLPAGWSLSVDRIAIDRAHVILDDPALELDEIDITGGVRVHGDTVELDAFSILDRLDGSRFDANGKVSGVKNLDALAVDLDASAMLAPALSDRFEAIVGQTIPDHPVTGVVLAAHGTQRGLHVELRAGPDGAGDAVLLVADAAPGERPIPVRGTVTIADLSIVSAYGGPVAAGAAVLALQGAVDLEGETRAEITLDGTALSYGDQVALESLQIPARVTWSKADGVSATGAVDVTALAAAGWSNRRTTGEWHFDMPAEGPPVVQADLVMDDTRNGVRRIASVRAHARASLGDLKDIVGDVVVTRATMGTGSFLSGKASVDVQDNLGGFTLDFHEDKKGPRKLVARGTLDLENKSIVIPELALTPSPGITWRATEPLRAQLVDGGVEDVYVALDSEMGSIHADVPRANKTRVQGQVRVRDLDLAHLQEVLAVALGPEAVPPMSGTVNAGVDGELGGGGQIAIGIEAEHVTAADAVNDVSMDLTAHIGPDNVDATVTATQKNDVLASLSIDLPTELHEMVPRMVCDRGPLKVALKLPQISYERIRQALPILPVQQEDIDLGGRVAFSGDPCSPIPELDALVGIKVGDRDIRVRIQTPESESADKVKALIDATLDGEPMVHVSADAALSHRATMTALIHGGKPPQMDKVSSWLHAWKVDVKADGIPLDVAGLEDVEGTLVGDFHVEGDGSEIQDASGEISIADGKVAKVALDRARVALLREDGDITLDLDFGFGGEGALLAHARANQRALFRDPTTAPLSLEIEKGTVPIAFLAGILHPALTKGEGKLTIEGTLSGTAKDPKGDLRLRVKNGSIDVPATGVHYTDIDLLATLDGTLLTVDHADLSSSPRYFVKKLFSGGGGKHTAHLAGSLDLAGRALGKTDLKLELQEFWASATSELLLSASGDLSVDGEWPALSVNGAVAVDEGRLKLDKHRFMPPASTQPHADIVFMEPRAQFAVTEEKKDTGPSLLDELDANIRVDLRRRMTIEATVPLSTEPGSPADFADAKITNGRLDGTLKVGFHGGEMSIGGSIETVEASAKLLSAQFDVKQGSIAFASADYREPNLNFELERDVGTYGTVTARVSGTPSALSIDSLTSDEYSDQADVLALLLFGKPTSEMSGGSGGSSTGDQAIEAAAGVLGGQLAKSLGGVADTVSYDSTTGLSAGWALSTDLFLTFAVNPLPEEDENRTALKLSWFIGNHTQADFATGDAGDNSSWLYWTTRF